jgi:hypothetical protein
MERDLVRIPGSMAMGRSIAELGRRGQQPIASSSKLPDDSQRENLNTLENNDEHLDFPEPSEEELSEEREQLRQCKHSVRLVAASPGAQSKIVS